MSVLDAKVKLNLQHSEEVRQKLNGSLQKISRSLDSKVKNTYVTMHQVVCVVLYLIVFVEKNVLLLFKSIKINVTTLFLCVSDITKGV